MSHSETIKALETLNREIVTCERCPRLREYCHKIAAKKKPEFSDWEYWGRPVPGFGDPRARVWIVGLAPAAHGANRTGRMFTGDKSGEWLFGALHRAGFANQAQSVSTHDGLKLAGVYISAAARCAPPDNKPAPEELRNCRAFLRREFGLFTRVKLFIALGAIGFKTTLDLLADVGAGVVTPRPVFKHGALYAVGERKILVSYHPSRQNTQTGLLTPEMWQKIFERAFKISSRG
jgi:uracil-DNA glycosylase family 4